MLGNCARVCQMKQVISCSRRKDVPSFYSTWLMNRLRAGYCHVINPFGGQVYSVSLRPEDCVAIVFWTRNPAPLLRDLDELDARGYYYYFHFSLLGYPDAIEPHNPPLETATSTFQRLSDRVSPLRVRWRYDPIVISSITPVEYHLQQFEKIARALQGYTQHCTFSFVHFYDKTARNLLRVAERTGGEFLDLPVSEQQNLTRTLAEIANSCGMTLNSSCDDQLAVGHISKNHCIDPELLKRIVPGDFGKLRAEPTRADCGCVASVDIGSYDTCLFGCTYCYATHSRQAALKRHSEHDPNDTVLWRPKHLANVDLSNVARPLRLIHH
jgi:DNA repair photolyase